MSSSFPTSRELRLQTRRLDLLTLSPADQPFLRDLLAPPVDCELPRMNAHCSAGDVGDGFEIVYDVHAIDEWVAKSQQREADDGHAFWLAVERSMQQPVGIYGPLRATVDSESLVEIGWYTHRVHRGRGYAAEAAVAIAKWVFKNRPVEQVHACILTQNIPSQRVAAAIGMQRVKRDVMHADIPHDLFAVAEAAVRSKAE